MISGFDSLFTKSIDHIIHLSNVYIFHGKVDDIIISLYGVYFLCIYALYINKL